MCVIKKIFFKYFLCLRLPESIRPKIGQWIVYIRTNKMCNKSFAVIITGFHFDNGLT